MRASMKKLLSLLIGFLVVMLAITPFARAAYDYKRPVDPFSNLGFREGNDYWDRHRDSWVDLEGMICRITVYGTAEGLYADIDSPSKGLHSHRGVGVYGQSGSAFHIGNGYFVTNAHVVNPARVEIQLTKNFSVIVPVDKIISREIVIGQGTILGSAPTELVWIDEEHDIALVKVMGNWPAMKDPGYRPGWTWVGGEGDLIFIGMPIAVVVAIREDPAKGNIEKTPWFEVRYGHIVACKPIIPEGITPDLLPWFQILDVTMDIPIYPGDSGSPVFGFVDGQPVIIGIARAVAGGCDDWTGECHFYSYFTRIDTLIPRSLEKPLNY